MWSVLFASLAVAMVAVLIVGLIRPAWFSNKKTGEIPKRSELATGGMFLLIVCAGLSASLAPSEPSKAEAARDENIETASSDSSKIHDKSAIVNETKALWSQLISATKPCDDAAKDISASANRGFDVYRLYSQAKDARELCADASANVRNLDAPGSAEASVAAGFEDAIERCSDTYMIKSAAYQKMLVVLDGDLRPSAMSDLEDSMKAADTSTMSCTVGIVKAAAKGDVPLSIFES